MTEDRRGGCYVLKGKRAGEKDLSNLGEVDKMNHDAKCKIRQDRD